MATPLKKQLETDEEAAECMRMALAGKSCRVIGEELGINKGTVSDRIRRARNAFRAAHLVNKYEEYVSDQLQRLDWIQREAAEAWHRSVGQAVTITTKTGDGDEETTRKVETLAGDPRYLDTILKAEQRKADLLGLDAPRRVEITANPEFVGRPDRAAGELGMTIEEATRITDGFLREGAN